MRWRLTVLFVSQLVAATTVATAAPAAGELFIPSGNSQRGRDVFIEKGCLTCHAVRGIGGRNGPDLAAAVIQKGVLGIGAGMWSHIPQMRRAMKAKGESFPSLSPDEVKDLLAYLLFIGFVVEPGDASAGRVVFGTRGCVDCHVFGGNSGPDGPSHHAVSKMGSPTAFAREMWNHTVRSGETGIAQGAWPRLSDEEMADLIAFLVGSTGAGNLPTDLPGSPADGKAIFRSKGCGQCHFPASDGQGLGPDLATTAWYRTSTQMAATLWNHQPAVAAHARGAEVSMPCFEGTEMADVIAYLYVLRSAEQVGDPKRGRAVFSSKKCADCHSEAGPGQNLKASGALTSPASLGSAMWNHAATMEESVESRGLEWPELTGQELADLLAFLLEDPHQLDPDGS